MRSTLVFAAAGTVLAALSTAAAAQTHTLYFGGVYAQVDSKAPALQGGAALPAPGALIDVGDAKTVGFGYVYHYSPRYSFEAVLGLPPKHKVYGDGFLQPFGQISSVKQVSPTAFVNYHFDDLAGGRIKPFVGLGLNFTRFIAARNTSAGDAASGGPTSTKLTDSWGLAVHAGLTVPIDKRWSISGVITHADVQSDATMTTRTYAGNVVRTTHITFRPVVYTLAVGYDF